jgi:hypothetical protein
MRYVINCDEAHTNAVDMMANRIMPIVQKARAESLAAANERKREKES